MNRAKLVDEDQPLFESLTKDLFPTNVYKKQAYPGVKENIRACTDKLGIMWNNP
jgi:hypothetical protein